MPSVTVKMCSPASKCLRHSNRIMRTFSYAFLNVAATRTFALPQSPSAQRVCIPFAFTGTADTLRRYSKNRRCQQVSTSFSTSTPPPTMSAALPTASELLNGRFPATVDLAGAVFHQVGMSRPDLLSALLSTSDGARGLFVALLADQNLPLGDADPLDSAFIEALVNTRGSDIRLLAVKNVVMPTAMVIQYEKTGEPEKAVSSRLTRDRAVRLLSAWVTREDSDPRSDGIRQVVESMLDSLSNDGGPHANFLRKWNYDEEQRKVMAEYLQSALPPN